MDFAELQKIGGFVPSEPLKTDVTWTPPEGDQVTFAVHVKRLSAGALERLWSENRKDRSHSAALIADAVTLGEKGEERLSYEQAFQLAPSLATALLDCIDRINPQKKQTVAAAKN
jgi:hypothetical protein